MIPYNDTLFIWYFTSSFWMLRFKPENMFGDAEMPTFQHLGSLVLKIIFTLCLKIELFWLLCLNSITGYVNSFTLLDKGEMRSGLLKAQYDYIDNAQRKNEHDH